MPWRAAAAAGASTTPLVILNWAQDLRRQRAISGGPEPQATEGKRIQDDEYLVRMTRPLLRQRLLDIGNRRIDQRLGLFQHDLVTHFLMQKRPYFTQRIGIGDQDQSFKRPFMGKTV